MARCSGDLLSPSPPAEKAATSSDEAGKPSASDGAGNGISIKLRNKDVPRIGDDIQVTVGAKQPRNLKELLAIRAVYIRAG